MGLGLRPRLGAGPGPPVPAPLASWARWPYRSDIRAFAFVAPIRLMIRDTATPRDRDTATSRDRDTATSRDTATPRDRGSPRDRDLVLLWTLQRPYCKCKGRHIHNRHRTGQ